MKHKRTFFIIIITSILVLTGIYSFQQNNKITAKDKMIEKLKNTSGNDFKFHENSKSGQISISGTLSKRTSSDGTEALKFIDEIKPVLSIKDVSKNFKVKSINKDSLGFTNIILQQTSNNIAVENGLISVHFDNYNVIKNITSNIDYTILNSNKKIKRNLTKHDADLYVKKEFADNNPQISFLSETVISRNSDIYFCYKYNIHYMINNLGNYDIYLDMHSGKIIDKKSKINY